MRWKRLITRKLARMMGGDVTVTSDPGKGTRRAIAWCSVIASPQVYLSFCNDCDDLSYRRAGYSHLQGTRKVQADHDNGAGQHADRDQSAFTVASHNKRAHRWLNGEPHRQMENLLDRPDGHNEPSDACELAARAHQLELGRSWP